MSSGHLDAALPVTPLRRTSKRDARHAGMALARMANPVNPTAAPTIRRGIVGRQSKHQAADVGHSHEGRGDANQDSTRHEQQRFAQDQPLHVASSRAKREPDPQLIRAADDRVRHGAVEAEAGDQDRQQAEAAW
jgi:hypothetical protein